MDKLIFKAFCLFALVTLTVCTSKKSHEEEEWPMMDEFHVVMADSFHPYKDSANLAPAIANASEMAALATKWSTSKLPEKVNTESVKADLSSLKTMADRFVQISQSGNEAEIGKGITELHDLFHKIQEAWYGGHGHHH